MGKIGARSQANIEARNSFSTGVGSSSTLTLRIDSSKYGSSSSRNSALRSKCSTSSGSGLWLVDIRAKPGCIAN
jgi:hypothetical protein